VRIVFQAKLYIVYSLIASTTGVSDDVYIHPPQHRAAGRQVQCNIARSLKDFTAHRDGLWKIVRSCGIPQTDRRGNKTAEYNDIDCTLMENNQQIYGRNPPQE
jgi:hypothetical protein